MSFHLFNEALGKGEYDPRKREIFSGTWERREKPHVGERDHFREREEIRFILLSAQKTRQKVQHRKQGSRLYCTDRTAVKVQAIHLHLMLEAVQLHRNRYLYLLIEGWCTEIEADGFSTSF